MEMKVGPTQDLHHVSSCASVHDAFQEGVDVFIKDFYLCERRHLEAQRVRMEEFLLRQLPFLKVGNSSDLAMGHETVGREMSYASPNQNPVTKMFSDASLVSVPNDPPNVLFKDPKPDVQPTAARFAPSILHVLSKPSKALGLGHVFTETGPITAASSVRPSTDNSRLHLGSQNKHSAAFRLTWIYRMHFPRTAVETSQQAPRAYGPCEISDGATDCSARGGLLVPFRRSRKSTSAWFHVQSQIVDYPAWQDYATFKKKKDMVYVGPSLSADDCAILQRHMQEQDDGQHINSTDPSALGQAFWFRCFQGMSVMDEPAFLRVQLPASCSSKISSVPSLASPTSHGSAGSLRSWLPAITQILRRLTVS